MYLASASYYCVQQVPLASIRVFKLLNSPRNMGANWLRQAQDERHSSAKPLVQQCIWFYLCVDYNRSLSRDSLILPMRLFCSCLCKVHSRISDALSQALRNLFSAFLADFTLSDSTALIRFMAFSRKLHSAFLLDRKTWSQRSHVFHLTGTAALQNGH